MRYISAGFRLVLCVPQVSTLDWRDTLSSCCKVVFEPPIGVLARQKKTQEALMEAPEVKACLEKESSGGALVQVGVVHLHAYVHTYMK